jgi:hypothetical protein
MSSFFISDFAGAAIAGAAAGAGVAAGAIALAGGVAGVAAGAGAWAAAVAATAAAINATISLLIFVSSVVGLGGTRCRKMLAKPLNYKHFSIVLQPERLLSGDRSRAVAAVNGLVRRAVDIRIKK